MAKQPIDLTNPSLAKGLREVEAQLLRKLKTLGFDIEKGKLTTTQIQKFLRDEAKLDRADANQRVALKTRQDADLTKLGKQIEGRVTLEKERRKTRTETIKATGQARESAAFAQGTVRGLSAEKALELSQKRARTLPVERALGAQGAAEVKQATEAARAKTTVQQVRGIVFPTRTTIAGIDIQKDALDLIPGTPAGLAEKIALQSQIDARSTGLVDQSLRRAQKLGITDPETLELIRGEVRTQGRRLTPQKAQGFQLQRSIANLIDESAQQSNFAVNRSGGAISLEPQVRTGLRGVPGFGGAGVGAGTPEAFRQGVKELETAVAGAIAKPGVSTEQALKNVLSTEKGQSGLANVQKGLTTAKAAPGGRALKGGLGVGALFLLPLLSRLLGGGEQELSPQAQAQMLQNLAQLQTQQRLDESLINQRGASAEQARARALLLQVQALQTGGGVGGLAL